MIPRTIHRIWLGGDEPDWIRRCGESWQRLGCEIVEWNDETIATLGTLINQSLYDAAGELAGDHALQFRADVLRYEILLRHGGVYVDADLELIDADAAGQYFDAATRALAAWELQNVWVNNALMAAPAGDKFVATVVGRLEAHALQLAERDPTARPNRLSGPQYVTRIYRTVCPALDVLDQALVYPYSWREIGDPPASYGRAFAVHHWNNKRRLAQLGAPC